MLVIYADQPAVLHSTATVVLAFWVMADVVSTIGCLLAPVAVLAEYLSTDIQSNMKT